MAHKRSNYYNKICSSFGLGEIEFLSKHNKNSQDRFKPKGCSASCPGTCKEFSPSKFIRKLYKRFYESYKKGEFVDAVLRTEDGGIYAVHRIVLCAESEYFRALFTSGLNSTEQTDIQLRQISSEALEIVLLFMYTFEACLNNENVIKVLMIADYLGIIALKSLCSDFIGRHMDSKNVVGMYQFAKEHFCKELETKAYKFIMKHFTEVSQCGDEILELSLSNVASIFGSEQLNVKNEEIVWVAVLRWINHSPAERKNHLLELIKQIRTGLMDTIFFVQNVKDHPLVVGNDSVKPLIIQTIRFLYDLELKDATTRDLLGPIQMPKAGFAVPRLPGEIIFAVGGWSGGTPTNAIETYDTRADRWKELPVEVLDSTPRAYHGSVTINNDIILIGGFDGIYYFNSVRAFNVLTQKWKNLAPMSERRCYVATVKLDNHVYVFGGYNGHYRLNTCERYDPRRNQWSPIRPMNSQRSDASATTYNGKLYVCGGFNGGECLQCAEMYDPSTNQWTYISPMRQRRSGVACVAYHGYIYVLGGFNGVNRLNSGEKYNPVTGSWCPISDMYNCRSNFSCAVVDDLLFVVGGFNGYSTIGNVECYDSNNREWYEATDLSVHRSALTCSVLSDLPNMHDYLHENREFSMEERRQRFLGSIPDVEEHPSLPEFPELQ